MNFFSLINSGTTIFEGMPLQAPSVNVSILFLILNYYRNYKANQNLKNGPCKKRRTYSRFSKELISQMASEYTKVFII